MRQLEALFIIFLLLLCMTGCAPYKICSDQFICEGNCSEEMELQEKAAHHWLYALIPRHRAQIHWYDVGHWCSWALFGNDDDGLFGETPTAHYATCQEIGVGRAVSWTLLRNPLHNFCFYVIGTAHQKSCSNLTLCKVCRHQFCCMEYNPCASIVFATEDHSSLYIAFNGWKPFVSIRLCLFPHHKTDFYVGWRERGNFGLKLQPLTRIK